MKSCICVLRCSLYLLTNYFYKQQTILANNIYESEWMYAHKIVHISYIGPFPVGMRPKILHVNNHDL